MKSRKDPLYIQTDRANFLPSANQNQYRSLPFRKLRPNYPQLKPAVPTIKGIFSPENKQQLLGARTSRRLEREQLKEQLKFLNQDIISRSKFAVGKAQTVNSLQSSLPDLKPFHEPKSQVLSQIERQRGLQKGVKLARSCSQMASFTQRQNQQLADQMSRLNCYHSNRQYFETGQNFIDNVDTQKLMMNTDQGFKILTARLNRIMYSRGENRLEPGSEYSYSIKPNGCIHMHVSTHLKEPPVFINIRKKLESQALVVYYSKVHKHPDFEQNQGSSTANRIVIQSAQEAIFTTEFLHLGIFSSTGCTFRINCSFRQDSPLKLTNSSALPSPKKKSELQFKRSLLDSITNEEDPQLIKERKRHHQQYFKQKVDAIISDKDVLREFMESVQEIKSRRLRESANVSSLKHSYRNNRSQASLLGHQKQKEEASKESSVEAPPPPSKNWKLRLGLKKGARATALETV